MTIFYQWIIMWWPKGHEIIISITLYNHNSDYYEPGPAFINADPGFDFNTKFFRL
jgi:hypothetical protein